MTLLTVGRKFIFVTSVLTLIVSILFYMNMDVKHTLCLIAAMGYLDFLGTHFVDSATKCVAETSTFYLKRDLPAGNGKILPVVEMDCSNNFTLAKFQQLTDDFTRPGICRNFLKGNKCRHWELNYFREVGNPNDTFRVQQLNEVKGNRRAFMRHTYPSVVLTAKETYDRFSKGEQIYVSFDNYFSKNNPKFIEDLNLKESIPEVEKWTFHTFFVSNFTHSTLGSPFHAAPNDNFFFQCRGRKHWFYVSPHDLHYTSAYIGHGVVFSSNHIDEKLIVDRLTIYEARLEEGDMMYNPPYWLHAVGTVPGFTVSVANRMWRNIIPKKTNLYFDIIYKISFPNSVASILWQMFITKVDRVNSITLQSELRVDSVEGGALTVMD